MHERRPAPGASVSREGWGSLSQRRWIRPRHHPSARRYGTAWGPGSYGWWWWCRGPGPTAPRPPAWASWSSWEPAMEGKITPDNTWIWDMPSRAICIWSVMAVTCSSRECVGPQATSCPDKTITAFLMLLTIMEREDQFHQNVSFATLI